MLGLPDVIPACLFDLDGVLTKTAKIHAAGVEAGRAGGFGYVVGVDRTGQADALRRRGADIMVADLSELLERE